MNVHVPQRAQTPNIASNKALTLCQPVSSLDAAARQLTNRALAGQKFTNDAGQVMR
jgi:wobble nucleotide-excising tRNase